MTLLRVRTRVAILLGVTGVGLAFAGSAFAHANVSPAVVLAKNAQVFALAVPTEKENAFTTQVELTPPSGFSIDSFASPKSITVFGFRNSGFSMPAKPGFMLRFSTTTCCDWSTLRIGIP